MKLIDISTPRYPNTFAKVSDEDYQILNKWKWHAHKKLHVTYVSRSVYGPDGKSLHVLMHRQILEPRSDEQVDHADGDGLNNQRSNLRICDSSQNQANARKRNGTKFPDYKGIGWDPVIQAYNAQTSKHDRTYSVSGFSTPKAAARAYDEMARKVHKEFARTNFEPKLIPVIKDPMADLFPLDCGIPA